MTILEGKWDCSNCGKKRIAGRHKNCPSCNDPRDQVLNPSEKTYLEDDAPEVTDPALLDLANAGPDWNCGHCDTANRGDSDTCSVCNEPRGSDDTVMGTTTYLEGKSARGVEFDSRPEPGDRIEDPFDEATRIVEGNGEEPRIMDYLTMRGEDLPRNSYAEPDVEYSSDSRGGAIGVVKEFGTNHRQGLLISGGVAAALLVLLTTLGAVHYFTATKPVELTVTSLTWERRVEVEEYRTLVEEGWSVPERGREISSERAIHHYETVHDGWHTEYYTEYETYQSGTRTESYACGSHSVDLGNGFYSTETDYCDRTVPEYSTRPVQRSRQVEDTHQEPVYRTRYTYEIERWVHDHWVTAEGGDSELNREPHWPEVSGLSDIQRLSGVREGTYTVGLVSDKDQTYSRNTSLENWSQLEVGQVITGHVRRSGHLSSVDWPTSVAA